MDMAVNERAIIGGNSAAFGQTIRQPPASPKKPTGRFPYFKFYPRDWLDATREMTLEQRGAYIDLICVLMEMEGHLADNDAWVAHQMHISARKWRSVKKQLVDHEKIRIADGRIVNDRCLKELDSMLAQRRTVTDSAVSRERTKREKRENNNENNDDNTTTVPLRAGTLDSDSDLEETDTSLRSVSGADAPEPDDLPNAKDTVWREGLEWLAKASGKRKDNLRSLIGRWLKEVKPEELLAFMRAAAKAKTGDPISYITDIVNQHARSAHSVRRENGRIVALNGFKAELESILAGRDLQRSLDQIGGRIPVGISGLDLEIKVRGLAVEMVEKVADQDRRYASTVAQNADSAARGGGAKSWNDKRQESANDWLYSDLDRRERKGPMMPRFEEAE